MAVRIKKKNIFTILKIIFYVSPLCFGTIGFLSVYENDLSWAAYSAVQLYMGQLSYLDGNVYIEIAKWLAVCVIASWVFLIIRSLGGAVANFFKCFSEDSCAVYGKSACAKRLAEELKWKGIAAEKPVSRAGRHVLLLDTDGENLDFLAKNADKFKQNPVFIKLDDAMPHSLEGGNIMAFSMAEITARLYWKSYPALANEKIAIIGFGSLGRELLHFGLILNIYLPAESVIEYHVWGESESYTGLHPQLSCVDGDKIVFHREDWRAGLLKAGGFDRLILCGDTSRNIVDLSVISSLAECRDIYVCADSEESVGVFQNFECNIIPFGAAERLSAKEIILKESLIENARRLHGNYTAKYPDMRPWEELNGFLKRSNISAADFADVIRRRKEEGKTDEELAELEHIRWCRFHWLNNWSYAEKRDNSRKKHNMLISYSELSEEEKQKDRDNVVMLLKATAGS